MLSYGFGFGFFFFVRSWVVWRNGLLLEWLVWWKLVFRECQVCWRIFDEITDSHVLNIPVNVDFEDFFHNFCDNGRFLIGWKQGRDGVGLTPSFPWVKPATNKYPTLTVTELGHQCWSLQLGSHILWPQCFPTQTFLKWKAKTEC